MIDWDIIQITAFVQATLAALWKLDKMIDARVAGLLETRLAQLKVWSVERFVSKEEFNHLHDELHRNQK